MEDERNAPATKGDIAGLRKDIEGDIAGLRKDIEGDIANLRKDIEGDIANLRKDIEGDIANLRKDTKGDIADLKQDTKGDIADLKQEIAMVRSEMHHTHDALIERMADNQTELLKAFYSFASTAEVKFKETEMADVMLRQRLTAMESRLLEVEKRLNMPPAA